MSRINLNKHKDAIDNAWKEVTNPQSKNDWAVFGYDGKTYDLKVVGTGEDGFEEMVDEFSGGKIMYAVCRVNDPNTNLPKMVFVNWQGEGVPANVKGVCANHLRDVTNVFRGCHVTVNARSEDDLDYDTVLEKVKTSSGANYSIHKEKPKPMEKIKPVGAVYKRINPTAEIDVNKRDSFWSKQGQEEQKRVTDEKEKITKQREEEEKKRKEREAREETVRDEVIRERSKSIEQQRAMQRTQEKKRQGEEQKRYQATLEDKEKDDQEFRKRSDSERRRRLQEAQNLIGSRQQSIDEERKKFTAAPEQKKPPPPTAPKKKLQTRFEPKKEEEKTTHEPVIEVDQPGQQQQIIDSRSTVEDEQQATVVDQEADGLHETVEETPPQPSYPEDQQIQKEAEIPKEAQPPLQPAQETASTEQEDFYDTVADSCTEPSEQPPSDLYETIEEARAPQATTAKTSLVARAIYDYQAEGEDEITFDPGDIITEIEEFAEGWWRGRTSNGAYGMFPANYVELIDGSQAEVEHAMTEDQPSEDAIGAQGLKARAIYDYQGSDDTEITFDPDDVIYEIEQIDEGWWRGTGPDGRNGLFPANYVELI